MIPNEVCLSLIDLPARVTQLAQESLRLSGGNCNRWRRTNMPRRRVGGGRVRNACLQVCPSFYYWANRWRYTSTRGKIECLCKKPSIKYGAKC